MWLYYLGSKNVTNLHIWQWKTLLLHALHEHFPFLDILQPVSRKSRNFSGVFRVTILSVSSKRRRLEAVIFIFIPFTTYENTSLQSERVAVLRMAFQARKVLGTFEKRAPGLVLQLCGRREYMTTNVSIWWQIWAYDDKCFNFVCLSVWRLVPK